jgi:hypothetical protein
MATAVQDILTTKASNITGDVTLQYSEVIGDSTPPVAPASGLFGYELLTCHTAVVAVLSQPDGSHPVTQKLDTQF